MRRFLVLEKMPLTRNREIGDAKCDMDVLKRDVSIRHYIGTRGSHDLTWNNLLTKPDEPEARLALYTLDLGESMFIQ